jgi:hypothetical protein
VPHASLKLRPGVDQNETPALNETGISETQLVRFIYDRQGLGLVQKLGGWTKFYPSAIGSITRALWAWADTESVSRLAFGTQNSTTTYQSQLGVITAGALDDITPQSLTSNVGLSASSIAGSAYITIGDFTNTGITAYNTVYIPVHIAIGGIVLFGLYRCNPNGFLSATQYTVESKNVFGDPLPALTTSASPAVPQLVTASGTNVVTVTLPNHGYAPGDTYPLLVSTIVGGLTLYGNYIVQNVSSASVFTISADSNATSSASVAVNGGQARYLYSFGYGTLPAGTGWGVGGWGAGGWSVGVPVAPAVGVNIPAKDWTLDNWGQTLVACPIGTPFTRTTTAATGIAGVATLQFASLGYAIPPGEVITVTGMVPSGYNGTHVVTSSTTTTVSFLSAATGVQTTAGTIVAENVPFQPIYAWNPASNDQTATILPNAPPYSDGIFVAMPQRQIIAWGSTFTGVPDPLLIRWCDIDNYDVWIGQATNQAGSYRIPKGSRIVSCIQGPQQALIWTDVAVWSMQYVGQPFVYSFNEVGTGCGLISRKAAASINGIVFWMGPSNFYSLTGNGVTPVPCPVWDVIFQDLDTANVDKIRVAVNSRFSEITWYYPTMSNGGEVSHYVKLNVALMQWDFGTLARSAWVDQSVLGPPIGADPASRYLYQHETSTDADGAAMLSSFRTGYFAMAEGDLKTFVDQVWPDMKWGYYGGAQTAQVKLTFYVADYPGQTPRTFGPFTLTQATKFITPRFRGRLVSIQIASDDLGSFWRLGNIRYRLQQDGKF